MEKLSLAALARELVKAAPLLRPAGAHGPVTAATSTSCARPDGVDRWGVGVGTREPGEATVHVLRGRVRLVADATEWEGRDGDLLIVPQARHTLHALEDAAVLLTAAKLP